MKRNLFISFGVLLAFGSIAQSYAPIATTGYTLDAVAENTTALLTTSGAIDGSNYVLYSQAYGVIYGGSATGLPNNGLIVNGQRTYQLQPYTANNLLYIPGLQADTLTFVTPAPYPAISLLAFATEGNATMDIKVRFTDGTTQLFTNIALADWFTGTNTVVTGFDRATRNTGAPGYAGPAGNPKMFYVDLNLTCVNSVKNVQKIVFQNTTSNPRLCIMAASGALSPSFTAVSSPVTCAGGTNGSATVTATNGVPPFTFTWPGQAAQSSNIGTVLPPGNVTYTITDGSSCQFTSAVTVTQNIAPTAPITITASAMQVCSGYSVELTTSGATTYTWSNNGGTTTTTVNPTASTLYSVVATTSDNCTVTGSITINTTPLPVLSFSIPQYLCINAPAIALAGSPTGGTFAGTGIIFNSFYANQAGAGTHTLSYSYTDANGCMGVNTISTTISTPTTVVAFTITPANICSTAASLTLSALPSGGTYTGSGVTSGGVFSPSLAGIGTRTVSYTVTDANNCSATKVSTVSVTFCSSIGINELSAGSGIELFPNPNNGSFTIRSANNIKISVVSETGQVVLTANVEANTNQPVRLDNLAPGIYFVISNDGSVKQKLVISR